MYYFSKILNANFAQAESKVREELSKEGFGVLTEINVSDTLKNKLNVDFKPYKILGACNPEFAYQALQSEDKIGTMLPCNVILQQLDDNKIEVAAIDPVASMEAVKNYQLGRVAGTIRTKLQNVIEHL